MSPILTVRRRSGSKPQRRLFSASSATPDRIRHTR
jgi:hypothetical protein